MVCCCFHFAAPHCSGETCLLLDLPRLRPVLPCAAVAVLLQPDCVPTTWQLSNFDPRCFFSTALILWAGMWMPSPRLPSRKRSNARQSVRGFLSGTSSLRGRTARSASTLAGQQAPPCLRQDVAREFQHGGGAPEAFVVGLASRRTCSTSFRKRSVNVSSFFFSEWSSLNGSLGCETTAC